MTTRMELKGIIWQIHLEAVAVNQGNLAYFLLCSIC